MSEQKQQNRKRDWLVVAGCRRKELISRPMEFLLNPDRRIQPTWAYGIVQAGNEHEAYDAGLDAWDKGLLSGQEPSHELMNWYVAPLDSVGPKGES